MILAFFFLFYYWTTKMIFFSFISHLLIIFFLFFYDFCFMKHYKMVEKWKKKIFSVCPRVSPPIYIIFAFFVFFILFCIVFSLFFLASLCFVLNFFFFFFFHFSSLKIFLNHKRSLRVYHLRKISKYLVVRWKKKNKKKPINVNISGVLK